MWTNDQLHLLIAERRNRNAKYHNIPGSSRVSFWNNIANIINERFSTNYTGYQCKSKFQNLVRDHTLMCQYMTGNRAECRTRTGFDQIHNVNAFSRRREERRRNHTSPPTYEEVSSMINISHHETTNRDNVSNVNDANGNSDYNTNDIGRNLDNVTYLSLPNLANTTSTPNIFASQNDSNISMPDIGGSQPSCMKI
ncbi:8471_t:CDS:2 [Cetraspora pellucida]|uniref:8471_t:CDS:1 n=1 Tax=Cetraspora pellucida TaxID=1433469 RepID=A0A9N8YXW6_9GLOM|nr:8471_t:CDS:2 [Cetraspora pellucida]